MEFAYLHNPLVTVVLHQQPLGVGEAVGVRVFQREWADSHGPS